MKKVSTVNKEYERTFIKNSMSTARLGKTVYIRREFHARIQRIIQTIGENEITLFDYIDNVLDEHFKNYREEITRLHEKKDKAVF
jgi:hypothetical protein